MFIRGKFFQHLFFRDKKTNRVCVCQVVSSLLALTCAVTVASLAAVLWYVRDSSVVEAFHQKRVFITGCDSGFGNLLARQLDGRGFRVIAACLTEKGAADLAAAASPRLKTLLMDVTDSASIRGAVDFVSREVGEQGEPGAAGGTR